MNGIVTDYVKRRLQTSRRSFLRSGKAVTALTISAQGGDMAGLSTKLPSRGNDAVIIGGTDDADIILVDDCVDGIFAEVKSERTIIGSLAHVSSAHSAVCVRGEPVGSEGVWERLPCEIEIGGVPMVLAAPARAPVSAATLLLSGIAFCCLVAAASFMTSGGAPAATLVQRSASIDTVPLPDPMDELSDLQDRIEQVGLSDQLTVELRDGTIHVSGQLSETRYDDWLMVHRDWDGLPNSLPVTGRVERLPGLVSLPAISAIRLEPEAYVLLAGGAGVLRTGDTVQNGWRVEEIEADALRLRRGKETVDISYGPIGRDMANVE